MKLALLPDCLRRATVPTCRWACGSSRSGTACPSVAKGEDVRHEHGRHLLLVDLVHLEGTVEPRHRAARGRLGLANDERQAVDEEDHVESLLHRAGLVSPLVAHRQPVVGGLGGVHQPHGHMLAVGAEGHGLLAAQPSHEILVGPHQPVGLNRENARAQVVDDLVGAVGLGGDFGVESDQRLADPQVYHHVTVWGRGSGAPNPIPKRWCQVLKLSPLLFS